MRRKAKRSRVAEEGDGGPAARRQTRRTEAVAPRHPLLGRLERRLEAAHNERAVPQHGDARRLEEGHAARLRRRQDRAARRDGGVGGWDRVAAAAAGGAGDKQLVAGEAQAPRRGRRGIEQPQRAGGGAARGVEGALAGGGALLVQLLLCMWRVSFVFCRDLRVSLRFLLISSCLPALRQPLLPAPAFQQSSLAQTTAPAVGLTSARSALVMKTSPRTSSSRGSAAAAFAAAAPPFRLPALLLRTKLSSAATSRRAGSPAIAPAAALRVTSSPSVPSPRVAASARRPSLLSRWGWVRGRVGE